MSPSLSHFLPLEPPATPMMLYIGAGYDLSPLLTFSPHGPPYPIEPLDRNVDFCYPARDSYTSFIFVDAKPRHTYAFMVPDFEEWKDVDARIKNVLYYSQGLLTRWRCVPGANDLVWFEGGGDEEHVTKRVSDPDWHCMPSNAAQSGMKTRLFSHKRIPDPPRGPLVTVYYLFNTLDVEMTRSPRMERMWSRVEALYVHGLMIHRSTGAGLSPLLSHSGISTPLSSDQFNAGLGDNLKRVYVLVGSWSGKTGVRHVDFIKKGRARARLCTKELHHNTITDLAPAAPLTPSFSSARITSITSEPDTDLSLTPYTLHSPSPDIIPPADVEDETERYFPNVQRRLSTNSLCSTLSASSCSSATPQDFHIPIPQIAWLDKLNNGKGGYYVSMTIEDCIKAVQGEHVQRREKEKRVSQLQDRRLWNLKRFASRSTSAVGELGKPADPIKTRLRFRTRPSRLQLNGPPPRSNKNSCSRSTLECEDFSQTVFSPTSTIFVSSSSPAAITAQSQYHDHLPTPPSVSSEWNFKSHHDDPNDEKLFNSNSRDAATTSTPWLRIRRKITLLFSQPQRYPTRRRHLSTLSDTTNTNEGEQVDGVTFW